MRIKLLSGTTHGQPGDVVSMSDSSARSQIQSGLAVAFCGFNNDDGSVVTQAVDFSDGTSDVTAFSNLVQTVATDAAITIREGTVLIVKVGQAAALTLAPPTPGPQGVLGGDDGKQLRVVSLNSQANTITTPPHIINGNKSIATLVPPSSALFVAYAGVWYNVTNSGATLSGS